MPPSTWRTLFIEAVAFGPYNPPSCSKYVISDTPRFICLLLNPDCVVESWCAVISFSPVSDVLPSISKLCVFDICRRVSRLVHMIILVIARFVVVHLLGFNMKPTKEPFCCCLNTCRGVRELFGMGGFSPSRSRIFSQCSSIWHRRAVVKYVPQDTRGEFNPVQYRK